MPRYYCDYCDTYLTHDSPSVRKQHNAGYKHKANVRIYYQQFEEQQTQSLIDQRIKEHLGQAAAFQNVGAAFNQHLVQRPRLPILPLLMLPIPGAAPSPLIAGIRPPVFPRPIPGAHGYMAAPNPMAIPNVGPPGAPSLPMQMSVLPGTPTSNITLAAPGGMPAPSSNGASSTVSQVMYQATPTAPTSGAFDILNAVSSLQRVTGSSTATNTGEGFTFALAPEASR